MSQSRSPLCNRVYPINTGAWIDTPPYWMTTNPYCPTQSFNTTNTKTCLKGRTLYVIGNSVARQNAFNIVEMLGGNPTKREDQRDLCPKHETTWSDSCHKDFADVKIKYLFLQFMDGYDYSNRSGFPYFKYKKVDNATNNEYVVIDKVYNTTSHRYASNPNEYGVVVSWPDDNCIMHPTRDCLANFFVDSKENDILMFTLGMSYLYTPEEEKVAPRDRSEILVDKKAWLSSSATNFKSHISATFKGKYIFRVAMAKTPKTAYTANLIPSILHTNKELTDIWANISSTPQWYTVDQVAINDNRDHLYNDHIHFNGVLTHATLMQVMNEVCPGQGDAGSGQQWPKKAYADKVVRVMNNSAISIDYTYYYVNREGILIEIEKPTNGTNKAPWYFASKSQMTVHSIDGLYVMKGKKVPSLIEGMLAGVHGDKTVYLLEKEKWHAFGSADVFYKHGFDFDKSVIHTLESWIFSLVARGDDMT